MKEVNRSALVVKWKTPYVEWANGFDDGGPKLNPEDNKSANIYLVSETETIGDTTAILRQVYNAIFESELSFWMTNEESWPKDRSFETFLQWFDVEFQEMVYDLVEDEILCWE